MGNPLDWVAVIPARGGSKRIPNKNIAPLNGKPLISYTVETVNNLRQKVIVSTDSQVIARKAETFGARVIQRPVELATDTSSTESVLIHVLDVLKNEGRIPEWIMTLPPTSPLRGSEIIKQAINMAAISDQDVDCIFTVTENRGDFWIELDGEFSRLFPSAPRRQQSRTPLLEENSALYLTRVSALQETGLILGKKAKALTISPLSGWDINTPLDLKIAETLLSEQQINSRNYDAD